VLYVIGFLLNLPGITKRIGFLKMNKIRLMVFAGLLSCTPAQVQTANTVITDGVDFAEYGCIMASPVVKSQELALVCGIVKKIEDATPGLLQFLDSLIEQREALKKNGMMFDTTSKKWMTK
jgi:hypothetical protein